MHYLIHQRTLAADAKRKMSLFRTLQNSPATISIFHNARVPASARVYASLEKAYFRLNEDKNQFLIDLCVKQMPTYDQFKMIYSNCIYLGECEDILKKVYPLLGDKLTVENKKPVTIKSLGVNTDRGFKVFSLNEYERISEAFRELVDAAEPEIDPSHLFCAPLVVDWDQNLIACDEDGLAAILAKYLLSQSGELSPA